MRSPVGGLSEAGRRIGEAWAFALGRPRQRSASMGGAERRGSVQLRNEGAQSPRSVQKKDFTPFRAWSAAPDDSGGFWDEGRESPTAGHSRTYQAFCLFLELCGEKPQGIICGRRSPVGGPWRTWPADRRGEGLRFRPSAPAVGQHGGSQAAGVCATEERGRTVPQER